MDENGMEIDYVDYDDAFPWPLVCGLFFAISIISSSHLNNDRL